MSHIVKNSKRLQWIKGFTFLLFGNHRFCFILGLLLHKGEKGMSRWSHRAKVTCPPWTSKSVPLSFIHRNFTVNDKHVSSGRKGRKRRRQPESISQLHLPPEEGLVYPASIVPFGRDICTKKNSIIIMTIFMISYFHTWDISILPYLLVRRTTFHVELYASSRKTMPYNVNALPRQTGHFVFSLAYSVTRLSS